MNVVWLREENSIGFVFVSSRTLAPPMFSRQCRRCYLFPASEPAGSRTCVFVVVSDFRSTHERVLVADGVLHDALATGWEIMHDDGPFQVQVRKIDDIDVSAIARRDHTAVMEFVGSCRGSRLFVD